jgi:hypothetical protein
MKSATFHSRDNQCTLDTVVGINRAQWRHRQAWFKELVEAQRLGLKNWWRH